MFALLSTSHILYIQAMKNGLLQGSRPDHTNFLSSSSREIVGDYVET